MSRFVPLFSLIVALGACAKDERATAGGEPIGTYAFRYVVPATGREMFSPEAEQKRLASLDQYVKESRVCRNGYTVVMRSPEMDFARADEPEDWLRYVLYLGLCQA
jgi:hypothetical protein